MTPESTPTMQTATTPSDAAPKLRYTPKPKGSWKKLIGRMKDCDLHREAMRLGAEWRAQMNLEGK